MRWQHWAGIGLVVWLVGCAPSTAETRPSPASPAAGASVPAGATAPGGSTAASAPTPATVERVVFALPAASGGFVPQVLARDRGFFREEGLEVELPLVRSDLITAAMVAGEADYTALFSPLIRNALAGTPLRLLATAVDKSTRALVVAPGITSVEQLRNGAMAVNAIGSGPYNTGVLALEHFGIDPQREVTWLAVGGPAERVIVVQQGAAQATIMSGAEIPQAEAAGLIALMKLDQIAPLPETGVGTTQAKLERQPAQVRRVVRAVVRSLQYLQTNRDGSIPTYMQFLSLSREEAEAVHDATLYSYSLDGTVPERSLRYTVEAEKQQLQMTEDVPFARVADFGPLYQVLAEMGVTPTPGSAR